MAKPKKVIEAAASTKDTNPKDVVGGAKLPLGIWPMTATAIGCLGLLDGLLKYGKHNWRIAGIKASVYVDAILRHLGKWLAGQDIDPDSGLHEFCHILANCAILVDGMAAGKLVDDREVAGGLLQLIEELTPHVSRLKRLHAGKSPRHYSIQDNAGLMPKNKKAAKLPPEWRP